MLFFYLIDTADFAVFDAAVFAHRHTEGGGFTGIQSLGTHGVRPVGVQGGAGRIDESALDFHKGHLLRALVGHGAGGHRIAAVMGDFHIGKFQISAGVVAAVCRGIV